jgi:hypothetical protein
LRKLRIVDRPKSGLVDLRLVVVREGGEGELAVFSLGAGLGAVGEDLVDPGLQRRARLEPVDAFEHGKPGLLHDLLSDTSVSDVHRATRSSDG